MKLYKYTVCIYVDLVGKGTYRIEQNFGGKNFWRNCDFETLAEKTLANPRLACIFVLHRECWRKNLGELWRFAKFAKVLFYTVYSLEPITTML